ncbi:hypothetical protein ACHAXA_000073 [Cyclostephanos tholiformis]|uniref:Ion transport domain-containing protein n=1 Tax=Cyclostephanos tholiformis TaxID=382380 RepID=A0ABD3SQY7_9STRA
MIDPDAGAIDASCSDQTALPLDSPTLAARSLSSTLGESESTTTGVTGGNISDGLDSSGLKNNDWKAVSVASESLMAKVEGECRDAIIEKSSDDGSEEKPREDDLERTSFKDPFPSPPQSEASTPQQPSALAQTTPLKSASINNQTSWRDPFPTPDVSVDSQCGTPLSARLVLGDHDDIDGDWNESILNDDFTSSFRAIPKIPLIEECTVGTMDDDHCRQNDTMSASHPRLESINVPELPNRKVSSESNFPLISMIPSVEDIWSALNAGPDGHELQTEFIDERIIDQKWSNQLKNSGKVLESKAWECQDSKQDKPVHRRLDKDFAAPANPSREGIRHGTSDLSGVTKRNTIVNASWPNSTKEAMVRVGQLRGRAPRNALTPKRRAFQALKEKSTRAVANAAGELIFSPVRSVVHSSSLSAAKLVRNTRQRLRDRRERRRLRRLARMNDPPRSWWICIPADHPCKVAWDVFTMIWAALGAYRTHVRIRDRVFDQSPLILLTEIWFTVDILLNFITEHKTRQGEVIRDGKAVWARYLTTWFIVDILSLIPWESIYVKPIVEKIKRRNIFQKTFFRSKAAIRVSRVLRGRHIKLFGRVSKKSGISLHRLVTLVIKYLPKYLLFLRNMRGALVIRALRLVHWLHNLYKEIWVKARNTRQHVGARTPLAMLTTMTMISRTRNPTIIVRGMMKVRMSATRR